MSRIPQTIDLRAIVSPIQNQENIGACASYAATALLEHLEIRSTGKYKPKSPLDIHEITTKRIGTHWHGNTINSLIISDLINITEVRWLPSKSQMLNSLVAGRCFVLDVPITESSYQYYGCHAANTGWVAPKEKNEEEIGPHSILVCGYHLTDKVAGGGIFLCKNSWGKEWGYNGYMRIPFGALYTIGSFDNRTSAYTIKGR